MKIFILVVLYGSQIRFERKFISKVGCESSIKKDDYGTFVLGDCEDLVCKVYNKEKVTIDSKRISAYRKNKIGFDDDVFMGDFYGNDFMCVESTL